MTQNNTTITLPKWTEEVSRHPRQMIKNLLKSLAFSKMKEYERQAEIFENRHKTDFLQFEKKVLFGNKEKRDMWDDYIIWKGLEELRGKWLRRYNSL